MCVCDSLLLLHAGTCATTTATLVPPDGGAAGEAPTIAAAKKMRAASNSSPDARIIPEIDVPDSAALVLDDRDMLPEGHYDVVTVDAPLLIDVRNRAWLWTRCRSCC